MKYGLLPQVVGAILLSPPLRYTSDEELRRWASDGRTLRVLVPERDQFLPPPQARQRFAVIPQANVTAHDAVHLWVGEKQVRTVLDAVVTTVVPGAGAIDWDAEY